jgi:hypothetical protein
VQTVVSTAATALGNNDAREMSAVDVTADRNHAIPVPGQTEQQMESVDPLPPVKKETTMLSRAVPGAFASATHPMNEVRLPSLASAAEKRSPNGQALFEAPSQALASIQAASTMWSTAMDPKKSGQDAPKASYSIESTGTAWSVLGAIAALKLAPAKETQLIQMALQQDERLIGLYRCFGSERERFRDYALLLLEDNRGRSR